MLSLTGYIRDVRNASKFRRQLKHVRAPREAQSVSRDDEHARVSALVDHSSDRFRSSCLRHKAPQVGRAALGAVCCRTGRYTGFAADGDRGSARPLQIGRAHHLVRSDGIIDVFFIRKYRYGKVGSDRSEEACFKTWFSAMSDLARDEVNQSELCFRFDYHLARPSRFCQEWPGP